MTQAAETATEIKKTTIRPKTEAMVKAKGGSFHTDDFIGNALAGLTVAQVLSIGNTVAGIPEDKYAHLNPGQQRMTVGNALRKVAKDEAKAAEISELADEFREANAAAKAEAAAAKAAAKAEAAA
jgi:hypothetical protein